MGIYCNTPIINYYLILQVIFQNIVIGLKLIVFLLFMSHKI